MKAGGLRPLGCVILHGEEIMEATLSKRPPTSVSALVPKIKSLIAAGDRAGVRYYREAGVHLNKIKSEWEGYGFLEWAEETFGKSESQLSKWMRSAKLESPRHDATLSESLGHTSGSSVHRATAPILNRINVRALAQERQDREKESKIQRQLALQLIDIGYKALATKLHPDKQGGSTEAFQRLKEVRDRLKEVYS